MPVLNIICPEKGRQFSTGVDVDSEKGSTLSNVRRLSQCPYCRVLHGWMPEDAFFDPKSTNLWFKAKPRA